MELDVVNVGEVRSRTVDVNAAKSVSLISRRKWVLDVIGMAAGPSTAPYVTFVSVSRSNSTRNAFMQTLIVKPNENIFVKPEGAIYLSYDPRTFMAFGAVSKKGHFPVVYRVGLNDPDNFLSPNLSPFEPMI